MTLYEAGIIFSTGFASVFLMGFQSRNVNHGHYTWAAGTSFLIGLTNAALWSKIVDAGIAAGAVYGVSGALAITSSMYIHERFVNKNGKSRTTTE